MREMTESEALKEVAKFFGVTEDDVFAECDEMNDSEIDISQRRYYVGLLPDLSGQYVGFMGYSYEEAISYLVK